MLNSENDHKYRRKSLVMVEKNLFSGKYTKKPWRFIQDVNEAFETIKTYHSKQTKTYIVACEVSCNSSCFRAVHETFNLVPGNFLMPDG